MSRRKSSDPRRGRFRQHRVESLETRTLLAADFPLMQNPIEPLDVNDDGEVAANDVLMVVNRLNAGDRAGKNRGFLDVNGDGQLAPMDVLMLVNQMARRGAEPRDTGGDQGQLGQTLEVDSDYSIDGSGNNAEHPEWGSAHSPLLRLTAAEYADGVSEPAGEDRPSAREISNTVAAQTESSQNSRQLTDITWLWGQFIDHDIDLTENAVDEDGNPLESFPIEVPAGDPHFDPFGTGTATIGLNRSEYEETSDGSVRQQVNQITAFLDGSVIYGSDEERAEALRSMEGGRLLTGEGDLLPFNTAGLANAGGTSDTLFLAGDVRANENAALSAMHTLWVREHNHWADQIAAENPTLSDEEIYQQARAIVIAELQSITYNEFLPALLGYDAIDEYRGYDSTVNPTIANVFSTAAYRFGHSMLSSELLRLNNDGTEAAEGTLSLSEAFFAPGELTDNGIDSILLGATAQVAQEIDNMVIDDVRNFLFGPPGAGGFDLASLNIQRGRDHGLADYNQVREDFGLERVEDFSDITSDSEVAAKLEELYGDVDNIDVWVGGLAEDHAEGSSLGELFTTIIADQFQRIRDGDANWYQNVLSGRQLAEVDNTRLSDILERNTDITDLRENVFYDESVMYLAMNGRGRADATLVVNDGQIELVNRRSGEVLESRDAAGVSEVHLVASGEGNRFTIDLRDADETFSASIVIRGGSGDRNSISLLGGREADNLIVDGNQLTLNGTSIDYSNLRLVRWMPGPGDDTTEMLAEGDARVVVDDGELRRVRPDQPAPPNGGEEEGPRDPRGQQDRRLAAVDDLFGQLGGGNPVL